MKIENVKRNKLPERKTVGVTIRITKSMSEFMKDKDYSPSLILREALIDLGFKEK